MTTPSDPNTYLTAEALARVEIDEQLVASGWLVQMADKVNLGAGQGVTVREFALNPPHEGSTTSCSSTSGRSVSSRPPLRAPPLPALSGRHKSTSEASRGPQRLALGPWGVRRRTSDAGWRRRYRTAT